MIRPITFDEQIARAKDDGGVYRNIYPHDGILWGCAVTTTSTQIEIASGLFTLCGRMIWVDGKTDFPLQEPIQNGYAQLKAKIDLNNANTQEECAQFATEVVYSTTTSFPELLQEDINNTGKKYEQELAVVKIENGNITGITRKLADAGIDAEKLGGQLPEYYTGLITAAQAKADAAMPKSGGSFTGKIYAPEVETQSLGNSGTPRLKSGSASQAVYLQGNSIQCRNYADSAYAPLQCSTVTTSANIDVGGLINMKHAGPVLKCASTTNWLSVQCDRGMAMRDSGNTVFKPITASEFSKSSSVRFKDILSEIGMEQAKKVLALDFINFTYKPEYNDDGGKVHSGIKAEQADALGMTDIIAYDAEGLPVGVDYSSLTPYLGTVAKNHDERIEKLEAKATKLDALSALLVEKGILTQEEIDGLGKELYGRKREEL